tara:strand:+ start:559 stop:963 length:405 start_codon:yes stop_codon:yes gene_type:complete
MKISTLMKDYIQSESVRSRSVGRKLLPESFMVQSDLPLQPHKNEWVFLDSDGPERLSRTYKFDSLHQRSLFIEELLSAEEKSGHHAKITISGKKVTVEVWTHDLDKVTELDKEYASECDTLYNDVSLIGFSDEY